MTNRSITLYAAGFKHPEGPAFDRKGNLFVVNTETGDISRISPEGTIPGRFGLLYGKVEIFLNTGGVVNGAKFHPRGDLYVADREKGIIAISPEGKIRIIVDKYQGKKLNGPNDLIFDYKGNLYFTDPHGASAENPIGCVYRLSTGGEITLIASGLAYPNGLVISPDGRDLLVAITRKNRVMRYLLDAEGRPVRNTIFSQLSGGWGGPDGMAMDVAGNLYIAHWWGGNVLILNPNGEIMERVPVGGMLPTNLAFGGPDRKTLFVTEAETGSVYRFNADYPGLPLYGEIDID
jgi:gluconolactonase